MGAKPKSRTVVIVALPGVQLLDVGPAQTAREHANGVFRLGHVGELWQPLLVEDDRLHSAR